MGLLLRLLRLLALLLTLLLALLLTLLLALLLVLRLPLRLALLALLKMMLLLLRSPVLEQPHVLQQCLRDLAQLRLRIHVLVRVRRVGAERFPQRAHGLLVSRLLGIRQMRQLVDLVDPD